MNSHIVGWFCTVCLLLVGEAAHAQLLQQTDPILTSLYPAGGRRGEGVTVELRGVGILPGENRVLIDDPAAGVTVESVEMVTSGLLRAKLNIAAAATPGRRMLRVHNVTYGATSFRYFFVGTLAEIVEQEPNNASDAPQTVALPVVVNGRVSPTLDTDWFRFEARAGQKLVAAVLAHGMDGMVDFRKGYLDTNLTLRDADGKILAASEDALGLDPLIHVEIPRDGGYTVQVQSLNYGGSDHAVYRLTLGEVPYPTAVFPPGGQRGQIVDVEITGPNVPANTRQAVPISPDGSCPTQCLYLDGPITGSAANTLLRGPDAEIVETEPNDDRTSALSLALPQTANGRFLTVGDEDWYRLRLEQGSGVLLVTTSQRHLGKPVDTELQLFDEAGKRLAENDDGAAFGGYVQCAHDFESNDSWLMFNAPAAGEYFVRVRDLNGTFGTRSIYRLSARRLEPDFEIYQWPDAVPVWGPGTSSSFVVEVMRWGGLQEDVTVSVENLPSGWLGSQAILPKAYYPYLNANMALKLLLTITAPADAKIGDVVPFRVIGRASQGDRKIEHEAQYMTLYGNSHNDRMHLRPSPQPRAFLCDYRDSWLETTLSELRGTDGDTIQIPVKVHRQKGATVTLGLVVNGPTPSAGCGWSAPITLPADATDFSVPLKLTERPPGMYSIVVARSWASDVRVGRPGPCTPAIKLEILPKTTAGP